MADAPVPFDPAVDPYDPNDAAAAETEIQIISMRKAEPHEIRKFFSYL